VKFGALWEGQILFSNGKRANIWFSGQYIDLCEGPHTSTDELTDPGGQDAYGATVDSFEKPPFDQEVHGVTAYSLKGPPVGQDVHGATVYPFCGSSGGQEVHGTIVDPLEVCLRGQDVCGDTVSSLEEPQSMLEGVHGATASPLEEPHNPTDELRDLEVQIVHVAAVSLHERPQKPSDGERDPGCQEVHGATAALFEAQDDPFAWEFLLPAVQHQQSSLEPSSATDCYPAILEQPSEQVRISYTNNMTMGYLSFLELVTSFFSLDGLSHQITEMVSGRDISQNPRGSACYSS
jgi:hypothetical protein